jgi:serine protease AprX
MKLAWSRALLACLIVAASAGGGSSLAFGAGSSGPSVDTPLQQLKAQSPHAPVQVIVQSRQPTDALQAVQHAAGQVRTALPELGAVAATVSTDQIDALASQPGVVRVAFDPPMRAVSGSSETSSAPPSVFARTVGAPSLWASGARGSGVAIAVLDSGVQPHQDLGSPSRIVASARFNQGASSSADQYGHGTWVAGIAAGAGTASGGAYMGIAPAASIVNLKVSDDIGLAHASDVLQALSWVIGHHATYNIRVVNLSFVSTLAEGYATSLLDAAVEMVWHSGVTVVVSAGNQGPNTEQFAPANDPYVITVGATDDQGTPWTQDDALAWFSSFGGTQDGFAKPDLAAPGRHIVGPLSSGGATLAAEFPTHIIGSHYIQLSGTSAAAPVVSGAVALLAQTHPWLTPDQVKWLLVHTARPIGHGSNGAGAGELNLAAAAAFQSSVPRANLGLTPNRLVGLAYLSQTGQSSVSWDSVSWDSVSWDSVSWDSVSWDSVSWDSVSWDSVSWDSVIGND